MFVIISMEFIGKEVVVENVIKLFEVWVTVDDPVPVVAVVPVEDVSTVMFTGTGTSPVAGCVEAGLVVLYLLAVAASVLEIVGIPGVERMLSVLLPLVMVMVVTSVVVMLLLGFDDPTVTSVVGLVDIDTGD